MYYGQVIMCSPISLFMTQQLLYVHMGPNPELKIHLYIIL